MGDDTLAKIARALVADIRKNLSVDWLSPRAGTRQAAHPHPPPVGEFDYPPEEEREAIDLVIKQMETFANEWAPHAPR